MSDSIRAKRPGNCVVRDTITADREDERAKKANVLRYAKLVSEKKPIFGKERV